VLSESLRETTDATARAADGRLDYVVASGVMRTVRDAGEIHGYHAHVYHSDTATRTVAAELREALAANFPVELGRWRDAMGPHPIPFYQVRFPPEAFASVVPWLALNHGPVSVLVHPETGDDLADHTVHALWIGPALLLRTEIFR